VIVQLYLSYVGQPFLLFHLPNDLPVLSSAETEVG